MTSKLRKSNYCKSQSLISANKIKPETWHLHEISVLKTLRARGYDVQRIKKITYLKHQICISYWNKKGGVCSGFFSYRIFEYWQSAVQQLVQNCNSLYEMHYLNQLIEFELTHYPYPIEMQALINQTIEAYTSQLVELGSNKRNSHLVA